MNSITPSLPPLIERFFTDQLVRQRRLSPHTVASYRDTFRLLFKFTAKRLSTPPSDLELRDLDAPTIVAFLDDLEADRSASVRTRNLRLTAVRSFFRFLAFEEPAYSAHIQRVLAIPAKRHAQRLVSFLTRPEIEAILAVPDKTTWIGRRDYALLLLAVQTGLRVSELTGLDREALSLGVSPFVHCRGKGRKERNTPLTRQSATVLRAWLAEQGQSDTSPLFPTLQGGRLSSDAVQYLLRKYMMSAQIACPSLKHKRVSPHVLRHTAAMELLQAGVDTSVIALWLGHESVETTQVYLEAHLGLKEAALARIRPLNGRALARFHPSDKLLAFLDAL